jgi:hypothetical protein
MTTILVNIAKVHDRIQQAAQKSSRDVTDITLMAVSKTQPASAVAEAHLQGGLCTSVKTTCRRPKTNSPLSASAADLAFHRPLADPTRHV